MTIIDEPKLGNQRHVGEALFELYGTKCTWVVLCYCSSLIGCSLSDYPASMYNYFRFAFPKEAVYRYTVNRHGAN